MEWTDAARNELAYMLDKIHASMDPAEVDPDEVVADIKRRMEAEVTSYDSHTITAETVRSAAAKLGIQELFAIAPQQDPLQREFKAGMDKPRRVRNRFITGWFWFTGIILPLITLGTEGFTHICLDTGLPDPLPTPFHTLLIAMVPAACFLGWQYLQGRKSLSVSWLGMVMGAATMIAIYYSLMFITITPFALIGFAAIIYFGIGLICFLPLSPLLSLLALLYLRSAANRKNTTKLPRFRRGMLFGLTVLLLTSSPMYITKIGMNMASSADPSTQIKGVSLLRWMGDEALMNRACYRGVNMPSDPISWLLSGGRRVQPDEARDIYYRATGDAFNTRASPTFGIRSRRNPGDEYDWDPELGGDVVAGRMKGLSLKESRIDGVVEPDAATAYMEWTMVFRNEWHTEREARAQIALPPGAVVSRLTLWIDGEEREAAFGGRSQVKQAYKKVVQRRRDPVLVTTYGPDRVLMQCYPVPSDGEMKIRIGITAPLDCLTQYDRVLKLPHLPERNFSIAQNVKHAVWFQDHMVADLTNDELGSPGARLAATSTSSSCWASDGETTVLQEIRPCPPDRPARIAIVLDTSKGMQDYLSDIAAALKSLPDLPVSIWLADDGEPKEIKVDRVPRVKTGGGKDNAPALRRVLSGSYDCVVWIHSPQAWDLGSSESLRQSLEHRRKIPIFDFQTEPGPNRLIEKMDNLAGFHTVPRYGTSCADLERLFRSFSSGHPAWRPARYVVSHGDPEVTRTDSQLIRLYALDQIRAVLSDGKPDNEAALQLALKYHLVTPVSGAVVLETQQQYEDNNLQPVDTENVPSVPEPGTLVLLLAAILLVFYSRRMVGHIRRAFTI